MEIISVHYYFVNDKILSTSCWGKSYIFDHLRYFFSLVFLVKDAILKSCIGRVCIISHCSFLTLASSDFMYFLHAVKYSSFGNFAKHQNHEMISLGGLFLFSSLFILHCSSNSICNLLRSNFSGLGFFFFLLFTCLLFATGVVSGIDIASIHNVERKSSMIHWV